MNINQVLSQVLHSNDIQVFEVQKVGKGFDLKVFELLTTADPQVATVVALSNLIETGMFALYSKNINSIYFNNKVYQELEGITPGASKASNLRAAILPASNANDEINSANFEVLDDQQIADLKIAVAKLKSEAGIITAENPIKSDAEKVAMPLTHTVKAAPGKFKTNNEERKTSDALSSLKKQNHGSSISKEEQIKDEKAYQEERNKQFEQVMEAQKKEAIKQKLNVYQIKRDVGIL